MAEWDKYKHQMGSLLTGKARRKGFNFINPYDGLTLKEFDKAIAKLINKPTNKRKKIKLARKVYVQQQIRKK